MTEEKIEKNICKMCSYLFRKIMGVYSRRNGLQIIRINCIYPLCWSEADYGYKNIICYCDLHAYGKKVVYYRFSSGIYPRHIFIINDGILRTVNGEKCYNCKYYVGEYICSCGIKRCRFCRADNCWSDLTRNLYCNKCYNKEENMSVGRFETSCIICNNFNFTTSHGLYFNRLLCGLCANASVYSDFKEFEHCKTKNCKAYANPLIKYCFEHYKGRR